METEIETEVMVGSLHGARVVEFLYKGDSPEAEAEAAFSADKGLIPDETAYASYDVTVRFSSDRPDVRNHVDGDTGVYAGESEMETGGPGDIWFDIYGDDGDMLGTVALMEETVPEWLELGDHCYLTVELTYDRETSLERAPDSARGYELRRGRLDRTTPGFDVAWSVEALSISATAFDHEGGRIYLGCTDDGDHTLRAVDGDTGETDWTTSVDGEPQSLAVGHGHLYAVVDGALVALALPTGATEWRADRNGLRTVVAGPSPDAGGVFAQGRAVAVSFDPDTGSQEWSREFDTDLRSELQLSQASDRNGEPSAVLFARSRQRDRLTALAGATGQTRWEVADCNGNVGFPLVADGRAYVGDGDDALDVIEVHTGETVRTVEVDGIVDGPAAEAVDHRAVSLALSGGVIAAVDTDSWERLWTVEASHEGVIATGEAVYFEDDRMVRVLDPETGEEIAAHDLWESYAVADQRLYGGLYDHTSAYDCRTHALQWRCGVEGPVYADDDLAYVDRSNGSEAVDGVVAIEATDCTRLAFSGVVEEMGDGRAELRITTADGPIPDLDDGDERLSLPAGALAYYGRFEHTRHEGLIALAADHEAVTGEHQRASEWITEAAVTVTDRGADLVTFSLTDVDSGEDLGTLRLGADSAPAFETGWLSIYVDLDEAATPEIALPGHYA